MTANEIFLKSSLTTVVCEVVNPIVAELHYLSGKKDFEPIFDPEQEVVLDEKLIHDCLLYGVCAQLMYMFGAKEDYLIFRELYEQKRHRYFRASKIGVVKDVFARGCDA